MVIGIQSKSPIQKVQSGGISKENKYDQVAWPHKFRYYYTSHFDEILLNDPTKDFIDCDENEESLQPDELSKRGRVLLKDGLSKRAKRMDIHRPPTNEQLRDKGYMKDWFAATQHFFDKSLQDVQDGKDKIDLFLERKKRDISSSLSEHKDI